IRVRRPDPVRRIHAVECSPDGAVQGRTLRGIRRGQACDRGRRKRSGTQSGTARHLARQRIPARLSRRWKAQPGYRRISRGFVGQVSEPSCPMSAVALYFSAAIVALAITAVSADAAEVNVHLKGQRFEPTVVSAKPGDTIVFHNDDAALHSVFLPDNE